MKPFFLACLMFVAILPTHSAWARKNHQIVLAAAGSGAVIGTAAGLVSYPFAKSTGTIVAGAVVGALLGTVYGFYLVDRRDDAYRQVEAAPTELDRLQAANAEREAVLRRTASARAEVVLPVAIARF